MQNTILIIDSQIEGPTITIMGGVHGDEYCGVEAIQLLQSKLKIKRGKLFLIIANPKAVEKNSRQVNYNLNRMFRDDVDQPTKDSYEYQRALEIRKYLDQSDYLLDIHASGEDSQPFILTERNGIQVAKGLNVDKVLFGIDKFHPGSTDGYMYNIGKIGLCVDCGYKDDPNSSQVATQAIIDFLSTLDMTEEKNPNINQEQKYFQSQFIFKSTTDNFQLNKKYIDFTEIEKNQVIGTDGDKDISFNQNYNIMFARSSQIQGSECFLLIQSVLE